MKQWIWKWDGLFSSAATAIALICLCVFLTNLVVAVLIKLDATSLVDEVVAVNHVGPSFQRSLADLMAFSNDALEPVAVHAVHCGD